MNSVGYGPMVGHLPDSSRFRPCDDQSRAQQDEVLYINETKQEHDYFGTTVFNWYRRVATLPSMIAACHIADNSVLEIAHPDFPELWTHPVAAAFTCSTLKEHRASSASYDWSQVYILMKGRSGQDLSDSVDRIYNAYELTC